MAKNTRNVNDPLAALKQETLKYKSADEFVNKCVNRGWELGNAIEDANRRIFINGRAIRAIQECLEFRTDRNPALFVDRRGVWVTPSVIRNMFNVVRRLDERFSFVYPHTIRHSYATDLLMKRVDTRYAQQLIGHTNLNITARYTHLVNEYLRDIYMSAKS